MMRSTFKQVKIRTIVLAVLIVAVTAGIFSFYVNTISQMLNSETESHLSEIVSKNSKICENRLKTDLTTLHAIAAFIGTYKDLGDDELMSILQDEVENNQFARMGIISPEGIFHTTDKITCNLSDKKYFHDAMQGNEVVDSTVSGISGAQVIVYALPIYSGGRIAGVLEASHDINIMERLIDITSFGGKSYSYIINQEFNIVIGGREDDASPSEKSLFDTLGIEPEDDEIVQQVVDDITNGQGGITRMLEGTQDSYLAYAPIQGENGWFIVSLLPTSVVFSKANQVILLTLAACIALLLIFIAIILYIIRSKNNSRNQIEKLAYEDSLTGCRNLTKFELDCTRILQCAKRPFAMVQLDVDRFKYINDIFGYDEGNQVLLEIARVLADSLGQDELFCRASGDHFLMLMQYKNQQAMLLRLQDIAGQIEAFDSAKHHIVLALGIYPVSDPTMPVNAIIDRANIARISNKQQHETTYSFYNETQRDEVISQKEMEDEMFSALQDDQFQVYLQPKYAITGKPKIAGAEALVRWIHPQKGLIPPDRFIPLFEKNRFILKLDFYVFEQVCRRLRSWLDKGREPVPVSVNFSRVHLGNEQFVPQIQQMVRKYKIPPHLIEIEITETVLFENVRVLLGILSQLKETGFTISMDDFGSGYSSLTLLKDIPVDVLKLDKSFMDLSADSERGKTVIETVITMAKQLHIQVVAEGVEHQAQADFLKKIGCDLIQGYLYARPMPIPQFEKRLEEC